MAAPASLQYTSTNHPDQMIDAINVLRRNEEFCDVTLQVGEFLIPAHRVILSACCPYFKDAISRSTPGNTVSLFNINKNGVGSIVDFFYTSAISITEDNVTDLLSCAITLQLTEIETVCCDFLLDHLDVDNAFRMYEIAWRNKVESLKQAAEEFICSNFDMLMKNEGFLRLGIDDLLGTLRSLSEVLDKHQLTMACDTWLQEVKADRQDIIVQMVHVFPDLRSHFLDVYLDSGSCPISIYDDTDHTKVQANKVPSKMALRRLHNRANNTERSGVRQSDLIGRQRDERIAVVTDGIERFSTERAAIGSDNPFDDKTSRNHSQVKHRKFDVDMLETPCSVSPASANIDMVQYDMYKLLSHVENSNCSGTGRRRTSRKNSLKSDIIYLKDNDPSPLPMSVDEKINAERAVKPLFCYPESEPITVPTTQTSLPEQLSAIHEQRFIKSREGLTNRDDVCSLEANMTSHYGRKMGDTFYNYTFDGSHETKSTSDYKTESGQPVFATNTDEGTVPHTLTLASGRTVVFPGDSVSLTNSNKYSLEPESEYSCIMCAKTFCTNTDLQIHLQTHGDDCSYSCQHCAETFSSAIALQTHQQTHSVKTSRKTKRKSKTMYASNDANNTKSLEQTSNTNSSTSNLSQTASDVADPIGDCSQQENQSVEKPFSCQTCSASFSKRMRLKRHMAIHSNEKKHLCTLCSKYFSRSDHLGRHIRTIHGESRQFICPCGKVCKRRYEYNEHIQSHDLNGLSNIMKKQFTIEPNQMEEMVEIVNDGATDLTNRDVNGDISHSGDGL